MSRIQGLAELNPSAVALPGRAHQRADASVEREQGTPARFPWLLGLFLVTLGISLLTGQDVFIFGYILMLSYAIGSHTRRGRPWSETGIRGDFMRDLGRVWPLSALDLAFQVLPPTLGVAFVLGFGPELTDHIVGRLPVAIGAGSIVPAVATLLVVIAPLTLVEEIVYRVVIQDGLSRSLGTPAAILVASLVFALAHAVGTTGSSQIVLCDVAGVALDGILFGIIYARTHNLAVTWATHYVVDVLGLLALLAIF